MNLTFPFGNVSHPVAINPMIAARLMTLGERRRTEESILRLTEPREASSRLPASILIRVAGSHFIWKMVRRLVGVLAEIGKGGMAVEAIDALLSAAAPVRLKPDATSRSPRPTPAELTAPASGLFLERVFYEGDGRQWPLCPAVAVPSGRE